MTIETKRDAGPPRIMFKLANPIVPNPSAAELVEAAKNTVLIRLTLEEE